MDRDPRVGSELALIATALVAVGVVTASVAKIAIDVLWHRHRPVR